MAVVVLNTTLLVGNYGRTDRRTFYLMWLMVFTLAVAGIYYNYKRHRSWFWKRYYYYNDYKL